MDSSSLITEMPIIAPRHPARPSSDRRGTERRSKSDLIKMLTGTPREDDERRQKDRRATPRLQVEIECEERVGEARYMRLTQDLSTFGLSTRHGASHPVGTRVHLHVHLPDGEPAVQVEAEVVGYFAGKTGMRLAFRNPSVTAARRIHRYLRSRKT